MATRDVPDGHGALVRGSLEFSEANTLANGCTEIDQASCLIGMG